MGSDTKSIGHDLSKVNMIFSENQVPLCTRWETWTWSNWDRLQHVSERWNISQYDVWLRSNYDPIKISKQYLRRKESYVVFQLIISYVKSQSKIHESS